MSKYNEITVPSINKTFLCRKSDEVKTGKFYMKELYDQNPGSNYSDLVVCTEMKDYIKTLSISENDVWADLGANIGAFGVLLHDKVKKIYGFEPHPNNCEVIKDQTSFGNITNYELVEAGVVSDDSVDHLDLYVHEKEMSHNLIRKIKGQNKDSIQVPVISFKKLLEIYPDINKVKMDIEGAEYDIIINHHDWESIDELWFEWHGRILKDRDNIKYKNTIEHLKKYFPNIKYPGYPWNGLALVHCTK